MKNKEILMIIFVIILFLLLLFKYYLPDVIYDTTASVYDWSINQIDYFKYKREFNSFEYTNLSDNTASVTSIPVILYHGIAIEPGDKGITLDVLKEQLFTLKKAGYETITTKDFYDFTNGNKKLPNRPILLTFDDGIKSSYYFSDPLLKVIGYTAEMFIISKQSLGKGSSYYLSKKEVERMLRTGRWGIQSHGKDAHNLIQISDLGETGHFLSNKKWISPEERIESDEEYRERIHNDFLNSKNDIENELGIDVIAFAFPFGDFGQNPTNFNNAQEFILEEIKGVYALANFYQVWPSRGFTHNYPGKQNIIVKRINVKEDWTGKMLLQVLENGRQKLLPFRDNFNVNNGWISVWGDIELVNNQLILYSSESVSSYAFLDGLFLLEDYSYSVEVNSLEGIGISLVSRFKDIDNYVSCDFFSDVVRINQVTNGQIQTLIVVTSHTTLPDGNFNISVDIKDKQVWCKLNNELVASTDNLNLILVNGGVGLKTWGSDLQRSKTTIDQVVIENIQ